MFPKFYSRRKLTFFFSNFFWVSRKKNLSRAVALVNKTFSGFFYEFGGVQNVDEGHDFALYAKLNLRKLFIFTAPQEAGAGLVSNNLRSGMLGWQSRL